MRTARCWALLMLSVIMVLVAACTPASNATPTALPDPQTLLSDAAQMVKNSKTVQLKIQLSGAPSYVDPPLQPGGLGNTIAFVSADGAYVAPDRVEATVVARILGLAGQVQVIAIGDDQWMRNKILTADRWVKKVFSPGFNAADLISSDQGIQRALGTIKNVKMNGIETIDGVPMYHISGKATGKDIGALTVGLIYGSDVTADIYIVVTTGRLDRVKLVQPDTVTKNEPVPTTWEIEVFNYNGTDIKIDSPLPPESTAQATGAATEQGTMAATAPATAAPETATP